MVGTVAGTRKPRRLYIRRGHPLTQGLQAAWPFQKGAGKGTFYDVSGHGLQATGQNTSTLEWQSSPIGRVVSLNDNATGTAYIDQPYNISTPKGSIVMLMKAARAAGTVKEHFCSVDSGDGLTLQNWTDGNSYWGLEVNSSFYRIVTGDSFPDGFFFVTFVWDADTGYYELFWNGESKGSASDLPAAPSITDTPFIGGNNSSGTLSQPADCDYSFVMFYDRVLKREELNRMVGNPYMAYITKPR